MILNNLDEIYQEVLEELSYRVGIVNLRNKNHVDILSEILDTTELAEYKSDILGELYKNVIAELDFPDKDALADYKSQHKMRSDTPVTIAGKETTVGAVSDTSKEKQNKQKEDSKNSQKQPPKSDNLKKFSKPMVVDRTNRLVKLAEKVKNSDKDTQKRAAILIKNWNKFMNATTEKEKVEAMREMAEYNLIQGHAGGKKVYVSNSLPVDEKYLTGDSGDEITKEMNRVMKENDIYIPMRGSTLDRQKADLSGKHNEAGVVAELDASNENIKNRDEVAKKYSEVGGDVKKSDEDNKKAANAVKESILQNFPNSKIIKATQVGGRGSTALNKLGIDPKTDPTDIMVEIQTESGETVFVKYSLKVYDDPRNITMKNSGVNNAGEVYLGGDAGNQIDTFKRELDKKYSWTNEMSSAEQNKNKTAYRQEYLKKYAEELEKISKTPEGQSQLLKMWQSVHGCGKGVSTLITNKRTGESVVHSPEYYCNPKQPFKIEYDGVKIVVNMSGKDDSTYLQLDLKTEKNNSKKLLFRHRIK
jgi:hypothetical protein